MRKLLSGLVLGGILALLCTGCSTDREPGDSTQTLYRADQVTILQQVHLSTTKASLVDGALDFTLQVDPENEVHWSTSAEDPENEVHWGHGVSVTVPAGAVTEAVEIHGHWLAGDDGSALGYEFGPEGLEFAESIVVNITVPLAEETIPADGELMVLYDREDGWYEVIENEVHWNTAGDGVSLQTGIDHFSKYLLGVGPPPDDDDGTE